jgi:ectoine hydroxylase-related dioxygenase (phytanoyl-CoA dioxygenase family)
MDTFDKFGYAIIKNALPTTYVNKYHEILNNTIHTQAINKQFYYEDINGVTKLCRVENFVNESDTWRELEKIVNNHVNHICKQKMILFKDKINIKPPGGGGFFPHQDVSAFLPDELTDYHVTALIPLKKFTKENGCLQIVLSEK